MPPYIPIAAIDGGLEQYIANFVRPGRYSSDLVIIQTTFGFKCLGYLDEESLRAAYLLELLGDETVRFPNHFDSADDSQHALMHLRYCV